MASYPRQIYLPPAGRPRWMPQNPEGWDLLYLSWGHRWYGQSPIPIAMHDGWVYMAVLEGAPLMLTTNGPQKVSAGSMLIMHPDCAYGWSDKSGKRSAILNWVWRSAPVHSALQLAPGEHRIFRPERSVMRQLAVLHAGCVREVAFPDETAFLSLQRARLDLDILLARVVNRRPAADAQYRMKLAVEFLRNNPAEHDPVQRLCEYLQISSTALKDLFHKQAGESPKQFVLRWRMQAARTRLESGKVAVKQVAYEFGYQHPHDFSRAFKRFFGATARHCRLDRV